MALRQRRVAIASEDNLALLGWLEEAVDRTRGLSQDGAVGRTAATTHGAAATVHQHQVDVIALRPCGDAGLRGMQGQRSRSGAGVFGRVRVAQHNLKAATALLQTALDRGDRKHVVQNIDAVLKVLKLLEQRDNVHNGHVLWMGEGQLRQLVDVGDVLRALGERDNVAAGCLNAKALLDAAQRAEGIENLAGHRGELAMDSVLADIVQGAGMDHGMLAELSLDHMEAKDDGLHRPVCRADRTGRGEGALDHAQVAQELFGAVVHGVRVAGNGGIQTRGHDQHDGAMGL